jgi:serine/threonine-protein kinase RsbW
MFIQNDLDENDRSEMEICLVEALNNVVRHSYNKKPDNSIYLEVKLNEESAVFIIKDSGNSRTDFTKPSLNFDPNDIANLPERGMGLYIIDRLMDKTTYRTENGKNIFTMVKSFQKKEVENTAK